jgi:hypothetical protein
LLAINKDDLVIQSVMGQVTNPVSAKNPYLVSSTGQPLVLPGIGGITYNVKVGDKAVGWAADHIEPGVSVKSRETEMGSTDISNYGLNLLACIGNEARVISGDAKGEAGCVTGKHGGIEHVLIDFDDDVLDRLAIGDKVQIRGWGLGLRLLDYSEIKVANVSPDVLKRLPIEESQGKLRVPVTHVLPAAIMGSGLGAMHVYRGDYDIQMFDEETVKRHGLESLRLGDLVAITDADHSYGRTFRTGAVSIGILVHTDCVTSGHGPGVTTVFTSPTGRIEPVVSENANIAYYLRIGRFREKENR